MKILIVEDDEENIALFQAELASMQNCTPRFARSRASALTCLSAEIFDVVILDLRIPTQDGALDSEVNHGLAVHTYVREVSAGTPIVVFSAYGTVKVATSLAEKAERHDVWGAESEQPMTLYKEKTDFSDCLAQISQAVQHVDTLARIEISTGGRSVSLTDEHKRILRIFSRLNQGANVRVSPLGGGLSSARTVRAEILDENAATKALAVAKLGEISALRDEEARYHKCIAPALGIGGFAHLIRFLRAGAGGIGGLFYGFAKDYQQTLIDLLAADPEQASATIIELRKIEAAWQNNCNMRTVTIGDIRRSFVSDAIFEEHAPTLGFDWQALEATQIRIKWCCQHRDLHGLNVLIRDGETPLLIDYGEVEPAPACIDPLILELSLLFHPVCKNVRGTWPAKGQALSWANLDTYLSGTRLAPFIKACRDWAFSAEPLDKGVFASAYAYSTRQLKFPDTDHELAIDVATAAQKAISST